MLLTSPLSSPLKNPVRDVFSPAGGSPSLTAQVQALFASRNGGMWDMGDTSTLFQDTAGTTPVTAVTQPIGRVNDKSGNGNHATQPTAGSRPLYQVDGGYGCAQFDATDDALLFPAIAFGGAFNTFVAGKVTSGTQGIHLWRTADVNGTWAKYKSGDATTPTGTGSGSPTYAVNGTALSPSQQGQLYTQINGVDCVVESIGVVLTAETALQFSGFAGSLFTGNEHRVLMISGTLTAGEKLLCRRWAAEGNGAPVV